MALKKNTQSKMTATIITIYDPNPNYGNRLQKYASQQILNRLGFYSITINFLNSYFTRKDKVKKLFHLLTFYFFAKKPEYWKFFPKKIRKFENFNKKYIATKKIYKLEDIESSDFYIVGSDQVWNPYFYGDSDLKKYIYLLTFVDPQKKICLSPSFSVDLLPAEWESWFQKWLSTFPILGTREESGARIIKELTGKEAEVTIDPTLMLDKEDWIQVAQMPKNVDCSNKYILTYFLGGRSNKVEHDLIEYKKELNAANIYNLLDYEQPEVFSTDPAEFLYLVAHSELVVTDSFHACVFAFLFGKPFLCYDRQGINNMNSRMETFFSKFDLQRKYINSGLSNILMECDYSNGYVVLKEERKKLIMFLKKSMNLY